MGLRSPLVLQCAEGVPLPTALQHYGCALKNFCYNVCYPLPLSSVVVCVKSPVAQCSLIMWHPR